MHKVSGIQITKDKKGNPHIAHINLKKHGEVIMPYLTELGVITPDEFEIDRKRAITGSEVLQAVHSHIDNYFKNGKR